jgi:hypothetical protein
MEWNSEERVQIALVIAKALHDESQGVIMSRRVAELSELIVYALSMSNRFLELNSDKYAEWIRVGTERRRLHQMVIQ